MLRFLGGLGMGHEAQRPQTIGYAAIYNAFAHEAVLRAAVRAGEEAAAVDVDEHRQPFRLVPGRCGDAQIETVLAHGQLVAALVGVGGLHGPVAPVVGLVHTLPGSFLYRSVPAQFAHRRFGIRDGLVQGIAVVQLAFNLALLAHGAKHLGLQGTGAQHHGRRQRHQCLFHGIMVDGWVILMKLMNI